MRAQRSAFALALFILVPGAALAQKPRILTVTPERVGEQLAIHSEMAALFAPKIVGTIKSGLPVVLRFDLRLVEGPDREIWHGEQSWNVLYNLWSETYRLRTAVESKTFESFSALESFCADFHSGPLLPVLHLQPHRNYRIRVQVVVIPISAKQREQLRDVLEAGDRSQESNPAEARRNAFSINLSQLLSFFMGDKASEQGSSEWAESSWFGGAELQR